MKSFNSPRKPKTPVYWVMLCVLQLSSLIVLLRQRRAAPPAGIEARLAHFVDALALLTDTTQTGFASIAAELERSGRVRTPSAGRAAASKRIVGAARRGRSLRDIAADEDVSESEVRLHLGFAEDLMDQPPSMPATAQKSAVSERRPGNLLNIGA